MPPDLVIMPIAPTFCFRSVFCAPAKMVPAKVVWMVDFAVFARVSCGWKVSVSAAMAGRGKRVAASGYSARVDVYGIVA